MKKLLKKASKISIIMLLLLTLDLSLFLNCVQAVGVADDKVRVFEIGYCDKVVTYNGIPRGAKYVVYEENGKQYPAYCLNSEKPGVGDVDAYDVTTSGNITDVMLWRIITNGYPYKTLEELGVVNQYEAYLATKQAVYCYLENRNVDNYAAIGEAGTRTLNALKQILSNAQNSTETKISNIVEIIETQSQWKQDEIDSSYVSKTYELKNPAPITNYSVELQGDNIPNGIIITDLNNNSKNTFSEDEKFKILIPTSELKSNGEFEIKVETKMETKPVLFSIAPSSDLQNYALTSFSYEDSEGTYHEEYQKNEAQIKILKQEKETKTPLEGVEFELLDSNKNVIYQSLITNESGEIIINDIVPGTYYLKEVRTLQGFVQYDEEIKIDIHLNEQINVVVNNTKQNTIEISKTETNIEVSKEETIIEIEEAQTEIQKTVEVQKLPVTGM